MEIKKEWKNFTNELKNLILDNIEAFNYTDLKLYDVANETYTAHYPAYIERNLDSYFQDFCEVCYNILLEETYFRKYAEYIGTTSKFYLFDKWICKLVEKLESNSDNEMIDRIACEMIYNYDNWTANYLPMVSNSRKWNEEDWENMETIFTSGGYAGDENVFTATFEDAYDRIRTYKYIENVKKNQVTMWRDYINTVIEGNEEWNIEGNLYVVSDYTEKEKDILYLQLDFGEDTLKIGKRVFDKKNYKEIEEFWKLLNDDKVKEAFQL